MGPGPAAMGAGVMATRDGAALATAVDGAALAAALGAVDVEALLHAAVRLDPNEPRFPRLLAEVYGWFTEGFDTVDLQEAKALLGELSQ